MPGFSIANLDKNDNNSLTSGNTGDGGPPANIETHRDHRFVITNFMGDSVQKNSPFLFIKDITMPNKMVKTIAVDTIGTIYNFASSASFTDMKMTFYTSSDHFIDELVRLENEVHTVDEGIKDFGRYKKVIEIIWFKDGKGYTGSSRVKFTCEGCLISNVSWGQVSYGSSAIKMVDVTVKVDVVDIDPDYTGN